MSESFELSEDEAVIVQRAMVHFSNYLAGEFQKIATSGDSVSDLIKEAARNQYNELIQPVSELHIRLVNHFPRLKQQNA